MTAVLDALVAEAEATLSQLAKRLAKGEELPKEEIADALRQANWSPADLKKAIQAAQREQRIEQCKQELQEIAQAKSDLEQERANALVKIDKLNQQIAPIAEGRDRLIERAGNILKEVSNLNWKAAPIAQQVRAGV